ncbi:MAG: hypothetical protein LBT43_00055 [Prevotella sp.]|nr:hypothetical protein [Prevotella sp.]
MSKTRIVYNFYIENDIVGELHAFFSEGSMPFNGDKIYLDREFAEGIFLPKGKYRHKIEGEIKTTRDMLRRQSWKVTDIISDNPDFSKINLIIDKS